MLASTTSYNFKTTALKLNNDESIQHPEGFWSTLPFLDGMGIVSDKSSDDQTIHPDYAKVAGKTCHITLKIPLKLDDKGKRRAWRNCWIS